MKTIDDNGYSPMSDVDYHKRSTTRTCRLQYSPQTRPGKSDIHEPKMEVVLERKGHPLASVVVARRGFVPRRRVAAIIVRKGKWTHKIEPGKTVSTGVGFLM